MIPLPRSFLDRPIAHRGYHGAAGPENSRAAFLATIGPGYGIELDLQLSADGQAMVFHDYALDRLTCASGLVRSYTRQELSRIRLSGTDEGVPTLQEVLELIAGRVPLLVELKDQDGAFGPNIGELENSVADALQCYDGPVALMSFNPNSVASLTRLCPERPRGLTTAPFTDDEAAALSPAVRNTLAAIATYGENGESFISHQHTDLSSTRVAELKAQGASILCWTVRSKEDEVVARAIADNITFEGYAADIP